MDLGSLTIDDFLSSLSSSDPTPGGGALAALSGAMAAAMLAMVCNLTIGRPRYADVEDETRRILEASAQQQRALLALANADAEAYGAVSAAYRLPNQTDEEKSARKAAIASSMEGATDVPVRTAESAVAVLRLTARAGEIANRNMLGDIAVGAHLALSAVRGAADQARLNLLSLGDSAFATDMEQRIAAALADADDAAGRALDSVRRRSKEK
jgi:methenyltetrahydrofolate cyclohydrolase